MVKVIVATKVATDGFYTDGDLSSCSGATTATKASPALAGKKRHHNHAPLGLKKKHRDDKMREECLKKV